MEEYRIDGLSFAYPGEDENALSDINITIGEGEFLTICGKSGCGKTTFLRLIKPALSPHGTTEGSIFFEGALLKEVCSREQSKKIGFVLQSPDNQLVTDKVWHELAFGLESLGFSTSEIRARVSEMASFFGIETWFHKKVSELSGGQKQLLNLAAVMAMSPSVLILDEPTSQLDPIAAREFLNSLKRINRELGVTVVLSEHRLEDAFPLSDRILVMDGGRIIADDTPQRVCEILREERHDMYLALPAPARIYGALEDMGAFPLTVRDGRLWLEEYALSHPVDASAIPTREYVFPDESAIRVENAWFRYKKDLPDVIKGLNLDVKKGELYAILGGNGVGKTTALSLICGLNTAYRGKVLINGEPLSRIGNFYGRIMSVLPQNPQTMFVKKTVYLDLADMLTTEKLSKEEEKQRIDEVSELCGISHLHMRHPYDLSGGEQQRAALAKILLTSPEILLLDEPTKGMDAHFKELFGDILSNLKNQGITVVMVSHDIEFCAQYADRCALFFDGSITSEGIPSEFFKGKSFYTTSANRMARTTIPDAVLAEDIILACGGNIPPKTSSTKKTPKEKKDLSFKSGFNTSDSGCKTGRNKLTKRTLTALLFILAVVPATILAGSLILGDRKYYFISLFVILETMVPFGMAFESRRPRARELVVISVLCALAVAGRSAFYMVPQFKPVLAVIIIAGVCLGGEAGFVVGAVTGFVSNFFFGQGPWTPWQMFAFGMVGFLAGLLFKDCKTGRNRLSLCIYGAFAALAVYGLIVNTSMIILYESNPTFNMFVASCISGLPFDSVHAVSTAFFLWFISEPMIDKLERIKLKYGLAV